MKFINFAVVKFAVFLVCGILTAHFASTSSFFSLKIVIVLLTAISIAWFLARKQLFQNPIFGIVAYSCFFALGFFNYQVRLPRFQKIHYSHFLTEVPSEVIQLKIKEILKPDRFNTKYNAEVIALNGITTQGKLLVNFKKDSLFEAFTIDDVILVSAKISEIPSPLNPHQFDYATYLKTLGMHHQIRFSKQQLLKTQKGTPTLRGTAERLRGFLLKKLQQTPLQTNERAIVQALVLGQRNDINKELYSDYAAAGAVHILAVSGLHVGILFFLFSGLFSLIKRLRYGHFLHSFLIISCLWCFAFITGLSPSVTRAVTMFSFFALAQNLNRPTNTMNTLFLSFFVLLLVNPLWLFYVGFQLSYLAVFFILWAQPMLSKLYRSKNYILQKLWSILTVTIAAQLGIVPLSLYYFHQFPGLFFVTNLVVLPFLGILLGGGILIIVLAAFDSLPNAIALAYNYLLETLNHFISWIARQDAFLFQDIYFSEKKVLMSYLLLISLLLLWKKMTYKKLIFSLLSISLFVGVFIWDSYKISKNQLVIFHKTKHTLLGIKNGGKLTIFKNDTIASYRNSFPIKGFFTAQNISFYTEKKRPSIFKYSHKTFLIIDSLGVYPNTKKIDIVVLTQSPKVNLQRLLDNLQPELIIADGSNYTSYVNRWRVSCKQQKLPFHHTGTKGALIIE